VGPLAGGEEDPMEFDLHVVNHCNLQCRSCTHLSPLAERWEAEIEELGTNLEILRRFIPDTADLHINILGGEPLLHTRIEAVLDRIRGVFRRAFLILTTNGTKEPPIPALIRNNIALNVSQYIDDGRYEEKLSDYRRQGVRAFPTRSKYHWSRHRLNPQSKREHVGHDCFQARICTQVRGGRIYKCCTAAGLPDLNRALDTGLRLVEGRDYLEIAAIQSAADIERLKRDEAPLCKYCEPPEPMRWEQGNRDPADWVILEET
jgi:MoaA/NifB/PqqE/SkfB family radical SAM enzyme